MRSETSTFTERQRREQLLACTVASLQEVGFAGTSLAAVAARAGVTKGVIAYHWGSRDALLDAVVASLFTGAGAEVAAATAAAATPAARLDAYVEANLAWMAEHRGEAVALLEVVTNRRRPDGSPHYRPEDGAALADHLADLVRDARAEAGTADVDPASAATAIRALIDVVPLRLREPGFDLAAYRATVVRLVHRGILGGAP